MCEILRAGGNEGHSSDLRRTRANLDRIRASMSLPGSTRVFLTPATSSSASFWANGISFNWSGSKEGARKMPTTSDYCKPQKPSFLGFLVTIELTVR